jgi:hypothetical protein
MAFEPKEVVENTQVNTQRALENIQTADSIPEYLEQTKETAKDMADYDPDATGLARAGQSVDIVGTVLALIVVGVISYVGLMVMSETQSSTELESGSEFNNASGDLTSGVATAFGLMEVVFIVLLLSVIIGVLVGLRR